MHSHTPAEPSTETWEKFSVTIFRVNVTDAGLAGGLTVDGLCDEVLAVAGLSLATCPRVALASTPLPDPFRSRVPRP